MGKIREFISVTNPLVDTIEKTIEALDESGFYPLDAFVMLRSDEDDCGDSFNLKCVMAGSGGAIISTLAMGINDAARQMGVPVDEFLEKIEQRIQRSVIGGQVKTKQKLHDDGFPGATFDNIESLLEQLEAERRGK